MKPPWLEISLQVPAASVDLVSYTLTELGAAGVVTAIRKLDTFVVPDPDEPDVGEQTLHGYFPHTDQAELLARVRDTLAELGALLPGVSATGISLREIAEDDWAEGWKQHFKPFRVGPLLVSPTWEEVRPAAGETLLKIDPGMAFGTGSHATTRLCLEALVEDLGQHRTASVLDVGTGSGILAIAAALLGAGQVTGCDIEPDACRVASENADLNGVGGKTHFSLTPLEDIPGRFDLVLANILAEENIRLADALKRHLAAGGRLVLSGILEEKVGLVRQTFDALFPTPPQLLLQEEWACLIYRA